MNINLSRTKDDKGNLCFVMVYGNEDVFVDVEDYKEARQLGINYKSIKRHAKKGRRQLKDYIRKSDQSQGVERLNREDRERSERKAEREEARQRKEQERLQMIEDAKRSSKWFEHLSENDIFVKVVK
ncbi:hypothetical protein [Staphylococcus equorum]|uniref:DUF2992 family protein n=1 Tax=Staphylococcus equorum TaxID=246432 RepID=A0A9X4L9I7_9STAP|nr:hypothetical protein [Staphylococcus equorum]MDG0858699.1 hypothetical protein [Staphylococcus equorum]